MSESARHERALAPGAVNVLLVEDERAIYEPFTRALKRAGYRVTRARSAGEALSLLPGAGPDLVLVDLSLGDDEGRELCRRIRAESAVPLVVIAASGAGDDRVIALELGADDCIAKPFAAGEAIARIAAVLRRAYSIEASEPTELVVQDLRIDTAARRAWRDTRELELSRKEFDLLVRLARDAGRVVTRDSLMSDVWDMNWFGSTKTLDVHIGWLRRKLGDDAAAPILIRTVRGVGFRLATEQEPARVSGISPRHEMDS
jgi:two-component system, OmpR family, response regulator RegX3